MIRTPFALALVILPAVATTLGAAVHTALESSSPADGATIENVLESVELRFTTPVESDGSGIVLVGPDGLRAELDAALAAESDSIVRAEVPSGLPSGTYRMEWRVVSPDGHPIAGVVSFTYLPPAATDTTGAPPIAPVGEAESGMAMDGEMDHGTDREIPIFTALMRALGVGLLAALGGLLLFDRWLARWPGEERIGRVIRSVALLTPVFLTAHLIGWGLYSADPAFGIGADAMIFGTRPGRLELYRLGLALAGASAVLLRRHAAAAVFVVAALLLTGMSGHSASFSPELLVPARAVHVIAVALWLGGLLVLSLSNRTAANYRDLSLLVSSVALGSVIVLLITGVGHVLIFPTPLGALITSLYGTVLIAKLAGVGILVAMGANNRFRVIPRLPDKEAIGRLRRNAAWEVGVMTVVLVATGLLVYLGLPEEGMEMASGVLGTAGR